ncbi:hypothetical protein AQUCO_08300015v1 [Aquilegia coerulea]|uniref:BHLH domain-containing protein n=1 Tax=Aquilegia coerulea TaxID=218851 RepID=A0A2G5C6X5_AQUCA|nr:hypothetical protein AQUCO_08300015v1 [Aquilegia coerulea]
MATTKEEFAKNPISSMGNFIYPSSITTTFPSGNVPTMLCFNTNSENQKYRVLNGSESLSGSSSNNSSSSSTITKSKRSRAGKGNTEQETKNLGSVESKKTIKKTKTGNPTSTKTVRVRKEKLGDRIAALQQLVSPFGKTDTASVLHEAMGYIRFLHDQVQVLSSPYLQGLPSSNNFIQDARGEEEVKRRYDLKSRGLCLVPIECTTQVASSNGADFWSPATMGSNILNLKH